MVGKLKILVVDDQASNIQILGKVLGEEYDVLCALTGEAATSLAAEVHPDLILVDVVMPGMDGYEFCRQLKADEVLKETPVIFITSRDRIDDQMQGLELGAVDYIIKPFIPAVVRLRIRNQVQLKVQRDLLEQRSRELESALSRVRQLEGIIPICMYCRKVRDDGDYWSSLDQYITEHSDTLFSHGICPECCRARYPGYTLSGDSGATPGVEAE